MVSTDKLFYDLVISWSIQDVFGWD